MTETENTIYKYLLAAFLSKKEIADRVGVSIDEVERIEAISDFPHIETNQEE